MGKLPENGVAYETIVITENGHTNAAALSATRKGEYMLLRSFKGSDTFENLRKTEKFSVNYISSENKEAFINAAVKGWGDEEREFSDEEISRRYGFPVLNIASGVAICAVEDRKLEGVEDEIGETEILKARGRIVLWEGGAENAIKIGEDRNIMALVAYTRYLISEGEVRGKHRKRALELAENDDAVGRWVLEHL